MSRGSKIVGLFVLLAVAVGLGAVAWRMTSGTEAEVCAACSRPVHAFTRTVANFNGRTRVYCCLACALSEHRQANEPLEVLSINDFETHQPLRPQQAFIVRGSRVNHCLQMDPVPRMEDTGQPAHMDFDRCAPSMIAFGSRQDAEEFAAKNGGSVVTFGEIAQAAGLQAAH